MSFWRNEIEEFVQAELELGDPPAQLEPEPDEDDVEPHAADLGLAGLSSHDELLAAHAEAGHVPPEPEAE